MSAPAQPLSLAARPGAAGEEDLRLEVVGVGAVRHAAMPTLRFSCALTEPRGREVLGGVLSVQIHLDPGRRSYDDATRAKLVDLFGAPERWAATTQSFQWARVDAMVPAFIGTGPLTLDVPCTYDLEVAAAKYLYALPGGEAPLSFLATGMLLLRGPAGQLHVEQVPWSCTTRYALPVAAWRDLMAAYHPGGGWIRLSSETLEALAARRADGGHHSFDACVAALLEGTA